MANDEVHELECRQCGRIAGAVRLPVEFTGRILNDSRLIGPHCMAAWCKSCKSATEYRYLKALNEAA